DFDIINNGIDLNKFTFSKEISEKYKEKIFSNNRIVIGHVGNFVYQKNHDFLISVFNDLLKVNKNYLLLLVGEGPLKNEIEEKVKKLNISKNVYFLGKSTEVNNYLQAADMFVLPSHFEGLPVVLIEAQALGLPCLVSNNVSKSAKIIETTEFLPIDHTDIWVQKILEQSNDKNLDKNSVHTNVKAKGYDISENASRMKLLYRKYLKKAKDIDK
ncbi:glycosyltransferase, partial [Clostridium saudiense]|nr:glycosyltransferase [Clostridium saudiense]